MKDNPKSDVMRNADSYETVSEQSGEPLPGCSPGAVVPPLQILAPDCNQKKILDAVPVPIFFKDRAGRYSLVNKAFVETVGQPEDCVLGKGVYDVAPRELADVYHAMDAALLENPGAQVYESLIADRSGALHNVIFHKSTISDEEGTVQGIVGALLDVTELHRAKELLRQSNEDLDARIRHRTIELAEANEKLQREVAKHETAERKLLLLHQLVNQTSEAVFVVDPVSAGILEVNDAACAFTGYTRNELLALKVMDIAFARTDEANWREHIDDLRQKKHMILEDSLRCKDGEKLPVEVSVRYTVYEGAEYVFAILRDVSRRREMEMHIRMTNDILRLSSANISLKDYIDGLGHLIKQWCECSDAMVRLNDKSSSCAETFTCTGSSGADPHPFFLEQMGHADCACARALNGDAFVGADALLTAGKSFFCQDTGKFFAGLSEEQQTTFHASCLLHRFSSVAMIPIAYQGDVLGIIVFGDERENMLSRKTVEVLESLSATVAEVIRRHRFEDELKQSREQLRLLTAHIEEAREEERTRIAREIHDQLGQILTALKIDLSWLHETYAHDLQHSTKTRDMLALVNRTIFTVKKVVTDLRPSVLDHLGIVEAIEWQASEVQKLTGIRCVVDSLPHKIILEKNLMTHVFRIFQEIMTNVVRHSEASSVMVSVVNSSDGFSLSVVDDGRGILEKQASAPTSYGIMGMRERAHSMGGSIQISGVEPHGTMVSLWLPKAGSRDADRDV